MYRGNHELKPSILNKLQKAGHLTDLSNLLRLIAADKFPLNNTSFLLLLEFARWYSLDNTTKLNCSILNNACNFGKSCTNFFMEKPCGS